MNKIIWACWFQGEHEAPELVRKCLHSWKHRNPGWDVRILDARTIPRYIDLCSYIDLSRQTITAASLSDLLRVLLLNEYGGVWVDATLLCNVPLDDWLASSATTGFFAFSRPAEDRPLATWFLAAEPGNQLIEKWAARTVRYWQGRERTYDYVWIHHQFGELCSIDKQAFGAWQSVPRISALGPLSILCRIGLYESFDVAKSRIDWTVPVFKLTHRLDFARLSPHSVIYQLLSMSERTERPLAIPERTSAAAARPICMLKVNTQNLGDHIQIIAAENLLRRVGLEPSHLVDRDDEIAHPPPVPKESEPGILLNGWFKTNDSEWPPHNSYRALYLGFHIRLSHAPSLISHEALEHYSAHGPVGCRDRYTLSLLRSHGIDAFLSYCLSITFARRLPDPDSQREVFVVSADRRILNYLPDSVDTYTFINHYSESKDFAQNKHCAADLLATYRNRAKLIITTMLHCALPAIAMGIPVVVFYPSNEQRRESDLERFSSLSELVRVFRLSEMACVDWQGYKVELGALKLKLVDSFCALAERWGEFAHAPIGPIAPASILPPIVSPSDIQRYFDDPERLTELARAKAPDRQKWAAASSYKLSSAELQNVALGFIHTGSRVLEIGTGLGTLRTLIADKCHYTGADLEPLEENTLALDLDYDPMPSGSWDTIVLLGVLEYLHYPAEALKKIASAASELIISYCCSISSSSECMYERRVRGWANSIAENDIKDELAGLGFHMHRRQLYRSTACFEEVVFAFLKK